MASRNVIQFTVEVVDRVSEQLETIRGKFQRFTQDFSSRFKDLAKRLNLNPSLTKLTVGIGSTVAALYTLVGVITPAYEELGRLAERLDTTTEELSALKFTAKQVGVEFSVLKSSIHTMEKNIFQASRESGKAAEALRELNISAEKLTKLKSHEQFYILADALSQVDNRLKRVALAQSIYGGAHRKVLTVIDNGSAGLREYRHQLERLGGVVTENAAAISVDYKNSITNLAAAFDGLKLALVESGLVEALTAFNNAFARFISLATGSDLGNELLMASERILNLQAQIRRIESDDKPGGATLLKNLRERLIEADIAYTELLQKQAEFLSRGQTDVAGADTDFAKAIKDINKTMDEEVKRILKIWEQADDELDEVLKKVIQRERVTARIVDVMRTPAERFVEAMREARQEADLSPEQLEKYRAFLLDKMFPEIKDTGKEAFDFLGEAAKQAARNIQTAFADFFFDPFQDGVKGMLKGFLDAIRRMLAEVLAFKTISGLGIEGKFLKLLGRSSGGPASGLTMVGERGPELVNLPRGSNVINNTATKSYMRASTSPTFVTNIDARGADPGLIARLPQILDSRDKRLLLAVQRYARTGLMPI